MKRSRYSDEQIIGILKEQEAGMPTVARSRTSISLIAGWIALAHRLLLESARAALCGR